jgi:hypothetical protein
MVVFFPMAICPNETSNKNKNGTIKNFHKLGKERAVAFF